MTTDKTGGVAIRDSDGTVILYSHNLHGIHDRCRHITVTTVTVAEEPGSTALVDIHWSDGSHAKVRWGRYKLACDWSKTQRFAGAAITIKPR